MGEDFEDSVDTSSFDDISTDTTDTSGFSDPVDVGGMMDDIPTEPIESFDVEPIDSSFETDLPTAEATDINSLMDDAADTYSTEDVPSDALDSSGLDPSDISSDIDDYEMDAGSDIADLMDEAAIESLDEDVMDTTEVNEPTDNDIEVLMNDVEPVSDTTEDLSEIEMDTSENSNDNGNEVESLLATEELSQDATSDLMEDLDSDTTEETPEVSDVSTLMDESDVDDTVPLAEDSLEEMSDDFGTEDVTPVEVDAENEIGEEVISEETEPLDSMPAEIETESNADVTDVSEDEQGEVEEALAEVSDTEPNSPLDAEVSAYDQLADYYNSHNYGQQDYAEYSKDPEWQELNNAYLQELGREPIDYSGDKSSDISDIHDELIAAGIPEGSPELEAIMANEQAGLDAIVEAQESSSPPIDPIDGGASNPPIDPIESLEDVGSSSEPVHLTQSDVEEFIENSSDKDALQNLRDGIESGEIQIDVDDSAEGNGIGRDIPQDISEETPTVTDLPNEINYDEVFEGLDDYDFDGIDYASDTERLDSSLENFDSSTWEGLSLDEQKAAMTDLADYVKDVIGFDNPPEIVYYNNPVDGDYGGYSPGSNTLEVNEYMLYNNEEAADTVAHELWHAYQHQRANNPQSAKDYQYQYGFDNYIRPEDNFAGYQDQLVEAEARAFAQQFKDRLNMKGRRI